MIRWIVVVVLLAGAVSAYQKYHDKPRMYNGKKCASTTHYQDYHKGACGCGPSYNYNMFDWNKSGYVVAANQALFDSGGGGWCGQTCGRCIRQVISCLQHKNQSKGVKGCYVDGQGSSPGEGHSHLFMITNLCPNVWPNLSWCCQTPASGNVNQYGYGWHFDLENGVGQITTRLGWNNPEVTWEWTDCNDAHNRVRNTPSSSMYRSCQCG